MKIILKTPVIIFVGFSILVGICILIIAFSTVSPDHTQIFENWWTFVDELETGSSINPVKHFVTPEGNIGIRMRLLNKTSVALAN